ncbi:DUF411 domain-containing protein [Poseidonibacter ostreae]|jgi:hypothetical protein|uniref:DUF411 domain-containing protein n=1 Tax=Poseidonibacter ostreae TaxID=2654171 RepID=A0A6L4WTA7_9BACT|nr:DUF411 domain-containing protein [Poseidonibacter ostreae]KAB7883127.1 DUF411 domain-containing protein [Poseidonibacter ostreae]KAB7889019.1 DUF411 domain-containing protein [Poseidonibacter ostreae]KAB7891952.1 DUF411 domain-containing protein [Poseidonibacter ostreae]MAD43129.1 hypothetical protein [Arcobacter sp.]|tara:strand:- start:564 stop:992 length:429 start_codon:yes stop_codon:yes gene_type:complete
MKKAILISILLASSVFAMEGKKMTVYKSPYCGCCTKWIDIMKTKGFEVKTIMSNNMNEIKSKVGISKNMASCHTAIVDGYVIEGHVDYSAVKKMLTEKPNIIGITVPGMPVGSPGMEQGNMKQAYNVLSINKNGSLAIYEKH